MCRSERGDRVKRLMTAILALIQICKMFNVDILFLDCSIKMAVEKKACNCLLLKVNQIGSVTESIEAYVL